MIIKRVILLFPGKQTLKMEKKSIQNRKYAKILGFEPMPSIKNNLKIFPDFYFNNYYAQDAF